MKTAEEGILATGNDWQMRADVNRQQAFRQHIAITNLRPDIVLWSQTKKTVVLIELTVPYQERVDEAHERKQFKYQELVEQCQEKRVEDMVFPSRSRMSWLPGTVSVENAGEARHDWQRGKEYRKRENASLRIWCKREEHENPPAPSGI